MLRVILGVFSTLLLTITAQARPIYTGTGGAIPDFDPSTGNPGVFQSTITVNDNFAITDLDVTLTNLTHTWAGDLIIELTKIGGPTALLVYRIGSIDGTFGASSDYNGNYTFDSQSANNIWIAAMGSPAVPAIPAGTYTTSGIGSGAANNSLNVFNGMNAMGQWRLTITDTVSVDTGNLGGWSLTIVPAPGPLALLMFAGFARRVRRRRSCD